MKFCAFLLALWTLSAGATVTLPTGTPLAVRIDGNLPMHAGAEIRGHLIYGIYENDRIAIPQNAVVRGRVTELTPDHGKRVHARLRGDFTPFHVPIVEFNAIEMPDGTVLPVTTGKATNGAPIYRVVAPPPKKGGFIRQQMETVKQVAKDRVAVITGPDKGDRLKQLLYSQLPYHPERIVKGTAWTVETASPLEMSSATANPSTPLPTLETPEKPPTWIVQAYLAEAISSAESKAGQPIRAIVAEPVLNADGTVAVPQGSVLTGTISQTRKARSFGRAGELRFNFRQLTVPGGTAQSVQTSMTGADIAGDLAMTSEGEVKPKPKDKLVVPLILLSLAARPLDHDGHHQIAKNAGASNAVGVLGFIIGTAAQKPYLAAGIGYYGATISLYERIFRKGDEVSFPKDTRVVLQTTARRNAAMPLGKP
jgi:hypothetical protein